MVIDLDQTSGKDVTHMNDHMIKSLVISFVLLIGLTIAGCSMNDNTGADQPAVSTVRIECGWDQINRSIGAYKFGEKYFIEKDYKEDEEISNSVYIYNYDPGEPQAFKSVPFQVMLSFGQTDGYSDPMITVSLVDNTSKNTYYVIADKNGTKMSEDGTWFLEEDKDAKIHELIEDAITIFGSGEMT